MDVGTLWVQGLACGCMALSMVAWTCLFAVGLVYGCRNLSLGAGLAYGCIGTCLWVLCDLSMGVGTCLWVQGL